MDTIHDAVLNPGELTGRALDKSLEGALARVENRLAYGMIADAFDLAATYAVAISDRALLQRRERRTAFRSMDACLGLNGIAIAWETEEVGRIIIEAAQGRIEARDLAEWLRARAPE